jgi:hypothetical protein
MFLRHWMDKTAIECRKNQGLHVLAALDGQDRK